MTDVMRIRGGRFLVPEAANRCFQTAHASPRFPFSSLSKNELFRHAGNCTEHLSRRLWIRTDGSHRRMTSFRKHVDKRRNTVVDNYSRSREMRLCKLCTHKREKFATSWQREFREREREKEVNPTVKTNIYGIIIYNIFIEHFLFLFSKD